MEDQIVCSLSGCAGSDVWSGVSEKLKCRRLERREVLWCNMHYTGFYLKILSREIEDVADLCYSMQLRSQVRMIFNIHLYSIVQHWIFVYFSGKWVDWQTFRVTIRRIRFVLWKTIKTQFNVVPHHKFIYHVL